MNRLVLFLRVFVLAVTLLLCSSVAFAGNKRAEAASLIERAKQLSDIRADGAPAFRLKLDFRATKKDGSRVQGSYTEVWTSKAQWRRETTAGDVRRTEVAEGQKRFLLEPGKALLEQIQDLPALSEFGRLQPEAWEPEKIENRSLNGAKVRCVETLPVVRTGLHRLPTQTEPKGWGEAPALCFDISSGLLAAEVEPAMSRSEDAACVFSDYQKFGDRSYARSYKCLKGEHVALEARVVELAAVPQPDPELFSLPKGAKELTICPDPFRQPRVVYEADPVGTPGSGVVTVLLAVGTDGIPRDLSIESSPNSKLEKGALEAVRQRRFRPATCDGEPVNMKIAVQVDVHR